MRAAALGWGVGRGGSLMDEIFSSSFLGVLEAVTLAIGFDDMDAVGETVPFDRLKLRMMGWVHSERGCNHITLLTGSSARRVAWEIPRFSREKADDPGAEFGRSAEMKKARLPPSCHWPKPLRGRKEADGTPFPL